MNDQILGILFHVGAMAGYGGILWLGSRGFQIGVNNLDEVAEDSGLTEKYSVDTDDTVEIGDWWVVGMAVFGALALWDGGPMMDAIMTVMLAAMAWLLIIVGLLVATILSSRVLIYGT